MGPETLNQTVLNTTHALIYCIHGLLPLRDRDIPICSLMHLGCLAHGLGPVYVV